MMANRLITLLNRYERNYASAYVTWYEEKLDNFLEPEYNPLWILESSPEVNWKATSAKFPEKILMVDGSVATISCSGIWTAHSNNYAIR